MSQSLKTSDTPIVGQRTWDIYCAVIDNYGDVGVCWRLARHLAAANQTVRLFIDDATALQWMASAAERANITTLAWPPDISGAERDPQTCSDVVIEAFGCRLPPSTEAAIAASKQCTWINLEYLTAQPYATAAHGLPSPVMSGPAAGRIKWFFYPGFTAGTGGVLGPEPDPADAWPARERDGLQVGVFSYECPALAHLAAQAAAGNIHLFAAAGRSAQALKALSPSSKNRTDLAPMTQPAFDRYLEAMDLNVVRGEDSLVRAIWAGKPFIWHIYPQDDQAHQQKLAAFLDWLAPPAEVRALHNAWNDPEDATAFASLWSDTTRQPLLAAWGACVRNARKRLSEQPGLIDQLVAFVVSKQ